MNSKERNSEIIVKIKALAYHYGSGEITNISLGKAILTLPETTEILIQKLKVDPFSLAIEELPEFKPHHNISDIPWPLFICDSNDDWSKDVFADDDDNDDLYKGSDQEIFDNFMEVLENNSDEELDFGNNENSDDFNEAIPEEEDYEGDTFSTLSKDTGKNIPQYGNSCTDSGFEFKVDDPAVLVDKVVEVLPYRFWYKKQYFNNPEEATTYINTVFKEVIDEFRYYKKQLLMLKDAFINQVLDGQFSDNQIIPLPILICSFEDNNINLIIESIAKKLHYKFNFVEETLSLSENFNYKTMYPYTMDVIRFNDKRTDFTDDFHGVLGYYETGIFQHNFDYDEDATMFSLFSDNSSSDKEEETKKDFFFRNHIIVFLLQIDTTIDVDSFASNEQIKNTILNYHKDTYQNDQHERNYTTYHKYKALFKTIKTENLILFDYGNTVIILQTIKDFALHTLEKFPKSRNKISESDISKIIYLNILKIGTIDINSLKQSIVHTIYKLNDLLLLHCHDQSIVEIEYDIRIPGINDLLKNIDKEETNATNIKYLVNNFVKHSQKLSFKMKLDETTNRVKFTDFELVTIIKEGSNLSERPTIRFSDVIGCEEVKNRFRKIIDFYQNKTYFLEKGLKMSNRILLIGQPGTGKTMVAKAFAGEIGLPFYAISAAEVTSQQYAGWGATLLRKIFYKAKKNKPAVVFLDEIDAFGKRGQFSGDDGGVGYDAKSIMNSLLVLLDGVEDNNDVIVIGATNRPEDLDDALIRSKRFGLKFEIKPLTSAERVDLIKIHLKPTNVDGDYDKLVTHIKDRTYGDFSAAKIVELVEETQLYSIIDKGSKVTFAHFDHIIDKLILGEKITNLDPEYKKTVAFHEAGHAIVHQVLFPNNTIQSLSVGLRKSSVGITLFKKQQNEKGYEEAKNTDIINQIVIALAGMQSEKINSGHWNLGSGNDFMIATALSLQLASSLDLGSGLKPVIDYSLMALEIGKEELSQETREIIQELIETCSKIANDILTNNWALVKNLALKLEEKEDLNWEDISPVVKDIKAYPTPLIQSLRGVKITL